MVMNLATLLRQRQPRIRDERHCKWIRSLPCIISGTRCGVEAAHIRFSDNIFGKRPTGKGERPDDRWTVPLSRDQHADQHRHGEREWWSRQGINPLAIAMALYRVSGNTEAGENIIREVRERSLIKAETT